MLRCHKDLHSYTELKREIGLPVTGADGKSADRYSARYLMATYVNVAGQQRRSYRLNYPVDFPSGPCNYMDHGQECRETEAHKHNYQSKGSIKGCSLLAWDSLGADETLVIVEGEKAAAALSVDGYVAVSYIGGSSNAGNADFSLCRNRRVIVWPDDDEPGEKAGHVSVAKARMAGAVEVLMVWLEPALRTGKGDDAADFTPKDQGKLLSNAYPVKIQESDSTPDMVDDYPMPTVDNQGNEGDATRLLAFAASRMVLVVAEVPGRGRTVEPYIRLEGGLLDNGAALQYEAMKCVQYAREQCSVLFERTSERNSAIRSINHLLTPSGRGAYMRFNANPTQ